MAKACTLCKKPRESEDVYYCCGDEDAICPKCKNRQCPKCRKFIKKKYSAKNICKDCLDVFSDKSGFYEYKCDVYYCLKCMRGYASRASKQSGNIFLKCKHKYSSEEINVYLHGFCAKCSSKIKPEPEEYNEEENCYYCPKCLIIDPKLIPQKPCDGCLQKIKRKEKSYDIGDGLTVCKKCYTELRSVPEAQQAEPKEAKCSACQSIIKSGQQKLFKQNELVLCEQCLLGSKVEQKKMLPHLKQQKQQKNVEKDKNIQQCISCQMPFKPEQEIKKLNDDAFVCKSCYIESKFEEKAMKSSIRGRLNGLKQEEPIKNVEKEIEDKEIEEEKEIEEKKEQNNKPSQIKKEQKQEKPLVKKQKSSEKANQKSIGKKKQKEEKRSQSPKLQRKKSDSIIENIQTLIVKEDQADLINCSACNYGIEANMAIMGSQTQKIMCRACFVLQTNKSIGFHKKQYQQVEEPRSRHVTVEKRYAPLSTTATPNTTKKTISPYYNFEEMPATDKMISTLKPSRKDPAPSFTRSSIGNFVCDNCSRKVTDTRLKIVGGKALRICNLCWTMKF